MNHLQLINLFLKYNNLKLLLVTSVLHEKQVIIGIHVSEFLINSDFVDFFCGIPSAKEVMCLSYCLCLLVGVWLVCRQDYTKNTEQIFMELGWRMCLGPEQTTLTFGVALH